MSSAKSPYQIPKLLQNHEGNPRRVGIEIEMSGIDLPMIVCQCQIVFGGQIEERSPYEFVVNNSRIGDIKIELDFQYLKKLAREKYAGDSHRSDYSSFEHYFSDTLAALARNLVPCEVVGPPVAIADLQLLDDLVERLREHGAKGTKSSAMAAFGVHLNPELPALDAVTIVNYFKAFLCLQDWLIDVENVDLTRKISPYIDRFPEAYIQRVISPDYQPDLDIFMQDYFAHNPTRNRILDMMPLFAWLDEQSVREHSDDNKLNKRPTLHYRLPNSEIDDPDWSLSMCWNNWLKVEALANDADLLSELCRAYSEYLESSPAKQLLKPWKKSVTQWIDNL